MAQNGSKPAAVPAMAAQEINSICLEFITKYFGAFQGKPDAWPLDRFYNETSRHIYLRFGNPAEVTLGLDQIQPFLAKMKFGQCTFKIESISTTQPWPTRFSVSAFGQLSHPGREAPRKFSQTTVFVKFPPSKVTTRRQYLILKTVFRFVDRVVDDQFFAAVDSPKKEGLTAAATANVPKESAGKSSPTEKQTAVAVNKRPSEEKQSETTGQKTVLKNTETLEPIKEELLANIIIPTPNEKSTVPDEPLENNSKKISKDTQKKANKSNESAEREKQNVQSKEAKGPQKKPKKTKTKYTKFYEITEAAVNRKMSNIKETDKSLKSSGETLVDKREDIPTEKVTDKVDVKVNFWATRLSFADPSIITKVTPNDESVTKPNKTPGKKAQQKAKPTTGNQIKTKQPCIVDDAAPLSDGWQIKQSRKKKMELPEVTGTIKDQSAGNNCITPKENDKKSNLPSIGLKEKPKTLEPGVLKTKLVFQHPTKAKETPKRH